MELLFIICCVWNYFKAKAANLNAALWTFYTFIGVLLSWVIGLMIGSLILIMKNPQLKAIMMQPNPDRQAMMEYLQQQNLIVTELFALFCGLGGYLIVRNMIIKRATGNDKRIS